MKDKWKKIKKWKWEQSEIEQSVGFMSSSMDQMLLTDTFVTNDPSWYYTAETDGVMKRETQRNERDRQEGRKEHVQRLFLKARQVLLHFSSAKRQKDGALDKYHWHVHWWNITQKHNRKADSTDRMKKVYNLKKCQCTLSSWQNEKLAEVSAD